MKRSRYTEERIVYAKRQVEGGTPVADVCRHSGIAESTYFLWTKKFAQLGVSEARRMRQHEDEYRRLKRLVADLTLDKHKLGRGPPNKRLRPAARRVLTRWFLTTFGVSVRRAGALASFSRAAWYRPRGERDQTALRLRITERAHARPASASDVNRPARRAGAGGSCHLRATTSCPRR